MKITVVDDLNRLRAREADWAALHERVPAAGLFQSPAWVLNWIEAFAPRAPLHVVFASDERGALRAVLPLAPLVTRWRRVPVRALSACTNAHSVRAAMLFEPAYRDEVFSALMRSLADRSAWDLLLLDGCSADDAAPPAFASELPHERWAHTVLKVEGEWPHHLASRSRELRKNLRRAEADLRQLGALRFETVDADDERLFERWAEIDRASWKAQAGETVDGDPDTTAYYRGLLSRLAASGRLLSGLLWLDERPIAVLVGAHDKGTAYTLKTAMRQDLASARLSLGTVVMARWLEAVWQRPGVAMVDFVSKASYSDRWSAERLDFERRVVIGPSWRGRLAGVLDQAVRRSRIARLPKVGLPTARPDAQSANH